MKLRNIKIIIFTLLLFLPFSLISQQITSYRFSFGPKEVPGYIKVSPSEKYTEEARYGFDFGTIPFAVDRGGKKPFTSGFCTRDKPFFFSVKLPEGNYNIKITTGDLKEASLTTVRAESRRLIFEKIKTEPGKFQTLSSTINIRIPQIGNTGEEVKREPEEPDKLDWDNKLTFEFTDQRPCIVALEVTRIADAVTVFLAGNSTVADHDNGQWASWGQMLPRFLKPGIAVSDQAESGLSPGSFLSSDRLKKILNMMKPGDYLFIEFGHNDQNVKSVDDDAFKSDSERLRLFVSEFGKKGGIPVIVSPANCCSFNENGKITNSPGYYPETARLLAKELKVPFIDLNIMTKTLCETLGPEKSGNLFVIYPENSFPPEPEAFNDNKHFNSYGAYELSKCIIEGIKANNLGIKKYLVKGLQKFNPAKPDPLVEFNLQ